MSKLILSNDKLLDILPYFAEIGEKLEKEINKELKGKQPSTFKFIILAIKNAKIIKNEVFGIVSEVTNKPIDEVREMNIILTYNIFKEILSNDGIKGTLDDIINFTQGQSSEN